MAGLPPLVYILQRSLNTGALRRVVGQKASEGLMVKLTDWSGCLIQPSEGGDKNNFAKSIEWCFTIFT